MNPEDKEQLFETSFRFVSWLRNHTWPLATGSRPGTRERSP